MSYEVYVQSLIAAAKEWERGLMVADEYAERVIFLTAEYLKVK